MTMSTSRLLILLLGVTGLCVWGSAVTPRAVEGHPGGAQGVEPRADGEGRGSPAPLEHSHSPGLADAQEAAGRLVMDRLEQTNARACARIRRCPPTSILLVDGRYDHTDRALRSLGVRFRRCPPQRFSDQHLRGVRLVVVDCPGEIGRSGAEKARRFVERGGTLLTTDWAVLNVLEEAFPGTVRYTRHPTPDDVVRISHVEFDPLLRWVFPPGRTACWWLENRSFPVRVIGGGVKVLLASREMGHKYGSPVLALTFRQGRGRVVHLVSHTYLQRNELREPWERRSAVEEALSLRLPTEGEAYRRLKRSGALDRVRAGHLNAALSAQQFLLNVALAALGDGPVASPPAGGAPPAGSPPRVEPPPPPTGSSEFVRPQRDTYLRQRPGGELVLRVARGLALRVLEEEGGWLRVRTPAGQSGWLERGDLRAPAGGSR